MTDNRFLHFDKYFVLKELKRIETRRHIPDPPGLIILRTIPGPGPMIPLNIFFCFWLYRLIADLGQKSVSAHL